MAFSCITETTADTTESVPTTTETICKLIRKILESATPDKGVQTADTPCYNLLGQRVDNDYRGVVIQNNRKVVVK